MSSVVSQVRAGGDLKKYLELKCASREIRLLGFTQKRFTVSQLLAASAIFFTAVVLVFIGPSRSFADGGGMVVQLRTGAVPGMEFDSVYCLLFTSDRATLIDSTFHSVDVTRDDSRVVRAAEWDYPAGIGGGTYLITCALRTRDQIVAIRSARVTCQPLPSSIRPAPSRW